MQFRSSLRNQRERKNLEDPGLDWRAILKWIPKKRGWRKSRSGFSWLRMGLVAGCCERVNEPSVSVKRGGFRD